MVFIIIIGLIRFIPYILKIDDPLFAVVYQFVVDIFDLIIIVLIVVQIFDNRDIISINKSQLDIINSDRTNSLKAKIYISQTCLFEKREVRVYNAGLSTAYDINIEAYNKEHNNKLVETYKYDEEQSRGWLIIKNEILLPNSYLVVKVINEDEFYDIVLHVMYKDNSSDSIQHYTSNLYLKNKNIDETGV